MNVLKEVPQALLYVVLLSFFACKKDDVPKKDDIQINSIEAQKILFNAPFKGDTLLLDHNGNIDMRVAIEGYTIDSVIIEVGDMYPIKQDSAIVMSQRISSRLFEGGLPVRFFIHAIDSETEKLVVFKSQELFAKRVEDIASQYVTTSIVDGRLKLSWVELDKDYTQKYVVERWVIDNDFSDKGIRKYYQRYEVESPEFIDNYYVGEEAEYKITIVNNNGGRQDLWWYTKDKEWLQCSASQNPSGGFNIHLPKCPYYNFGEYNLTEGGNGNPAFIAKTNDINDTIIHLKNAMFGENESFWLRCLPNQLPEGYTEEDWNIYSSHLNVVFGNSSFDFTRIQQINEESFVYTYRGNIYKYNINTNQVVDSIVSASKKYIFLSTTPAGDYIYAMDEIQSKSPVYIWKTEDFTNQPTYVFQNDYILPNVSDNLVAIMGEKDVSSGAKLTLYNAKTGAKIYKTEYPSTSVRSIISSNGKYFFIPGTYMKLCRYENQTFKVIWENTDRNGYYFYGFNALDNGECYLLDYNNNFSIRSTEDFSEINSFTLDAQRIVNIDYYSRRILAIKEGHFFIYNLDDGTLEYKLATASEARLINNVLYSYEGVTYHLE